MNYKEVEENEIEKLEKKLKTTKEELKKRSRGKKPDKSYLF